MAIRTSRNRLVITMSAAVDSYGLQRLIEYGKYLEATSNSRGKQSEADKLAEEIDRKWWAKNKRRFSAGKLS